MKRGRDAGHLSGSVTPADGPGRGDRDRALWWAAVAVAAGVVGEWAYARAGASPGDIARDLAVGWSFAGAGLLAWWRRPANRCGPLMWAEGLTWFIGNLQGTGVPLLFAAGAWWEALNMAVLAHLVLAYPDGRLATRPARWLVRASYWLVAVGGLLRASAYDPSTDADSSYLACADCGPNALLVRPFSGAFPVIDSVYRWLGALLTVACVVILVRRWHTSYPARRRVLLPAWIAVLIALAFVAWEVAYPLHHAMSGSAETVLTLLSDLSQTAVPVAFLVGLARMRLRHAAVGNVVIEVGSSPSPHRLQDALVRALGDPTLQLGLRAGRPGAYVDPDGRPLTLPQPGSGRDITPVDAAAAGPADAGGRGPRDPAAVLVHDSALQEDRRLLTAMSASVRLCLDNARLLSEAATTAEEARAANSRMLRAADRERQRLERDLHDGAQTRLVLALMTLRRLDAGLARNPDKALRRTVADADRTLRQALDDLRGIAHGIHPAVLTREGLGPAITALAEQASVPVVVAVEPGRYPPPIETTAYFTVCEALSNTMKHARARAVRVTVRRDGGRLVVETADDGVGGADTDRGTGLRGLADRLAAVGGTLRVESPGGRGTRLRAELPCE
ncbi:signal transduction histidine kinase [Streptomyces aurantiacus]|uniref:sensor histidine kinase n=1 Tax=Streptomyces aurantiacus TaxID=47760 RepID=UPI00278DFD85|nr:sensor histidine kinase [Streptomyces aurantiacus]MDQ0775182.1 signal transduction histidine kinase [Streptomyces aurantiacus]